MRFKEEYYLIGLFLIALFFVVGIFMGFYIRSPDNLESGNFPVRTEQNSDFSNMDLRKATIYIPGVDNSGGGIVAVLETNIRDGSGFTLVNINDLTAGSSTQDSARVAVRAAKKYMNISNESSFDVIYNIKTDAGLIDGPSAGAAMAISLISLLENKTLNENISITGYVEENGIIGPASGIEQKSFALKEKGIEILFVSDQAFLPRDYLRKVSCELIEQQEYCEVNYVAEEEIIISGIKIITVKNLNDALNYFYY